MSMKVISPEGSGDTHPWRWGGGGAGNGLEQHLDVAGFQGNDFVFSSWLASYTGDDDYPEVKLAFYTGVGGQVLLQVLRLFLM